MYVHAQVSEGEWQAEHGDREELYDSVTLNVGLDAYDPGTESHTQEHSGSPYSDVYEKGAPSDNGNLWWDWIDFEGVTVASTASYMSEVEVSRVYRWPLQISGQVVEIPIRELDDPSDDGGDEASLRLEWGALTSLLGASASIMRGGC